MNTDLLPLEAITHRIVLLRSQKVLLDADLAALYGVPTKRFNEQVKRNLERFPSDFMFQRVRRFEVAFCDLKRRACQTRRAALPAFCFYRAWSHHGGDGFE